MILRISTHEGNFCSITLWCTTFDYYFNISSIPHRDSELFLCPTLMTRQKKHFSLFQYWSCYTTNVLRQQRKKKHCNCINFLHTNNVYVWKLYSIKIHLLYPFVYQYLSLPITIECYWGQKEKIWMNKRNI